MERVVKKTVEGSERRKRRKVEEKNSFQDSDEKKTNFTS